MTNDGPENRKSHLGNGTETNPFPLTGKTNPPLPLGLKISGLMDSGCVDTWEWGLFTALNSGGVILGSGRHDDFIGKY